MGRGKGGRGRNGPCFWVTPLKLNPRKKTLAGIGLWKAVDDVLNSTIPSRRLQTRSHFLQRVVENYYALSTCTAAFHVGLAEYRCIAVYTAAVSVLADDEAVTALRRNVQPLADLEAESTRVEHRSAANHLVMRQTAHLPRHVRQNINYTHARVPLHVNHSPAAAAAGSAAQVYKSDTYHESFIIMNFTTINLLLTTDLNIYVHVPTVRLTTSLPRPNLRTK